METTKTTATGETMKTMRQVQDFRNGYSYGYHEARHGETDVEGKMLSPDYAAGVALGLKDGATHGAGVDVFAADIERRAKAYASDQPLPDPAA